MSAVYTVMNDTEKWARSPYNVFVPIKWSSRGLHCAKAGVSHAAPHSAEEGWFGRRRLVRPKKVGSAKEGWFGRRRLVRPKKVGSTEEGWFGRRRLVRPKKVGSAEEGWFGRRRLVRPKKQVYYIMGLNHNSPVILQLNSLQPGELLLNPKPPGGA
jgi:hypothetical protein